MLSHTISTRDVAQALRDHVRQLERRVKELEAQLADRTIYRLLAERRPASGPEDNPADDEQPDKDDWDAWEAEQTGQPPSRHQPPSEIDALTAAIQSADAALAEGRNHFAAGAEQEPPTQLPVPTAPAVSLTEQLAEMRLAEMRAELERWAKVSSERNHGASGLCCLLREEEHRKRLDAELQLTRSCAQQAKATDAVYKWREWSDEDATADAIKAACRKAAYDWYSPFNRPGNSQDEYTLEQRIESLNRMILRNVSPLVSRPVQCEDCGHIIPRADAKGDQSLVLCETCEHVRVSGDEQQKRDHRDY